MVDLTLYMLSNFDEISMYCFSNHTRILLGSRYSQHSAAKANTFPTYIVVTLAACIPNHLLVCDSLSKMCDFIPLLTT